MSVSLRHAALLATTVVAGLALTACTPPNQNPSDEKVATATSFAAPTPRSTSAAASSAARTTSAAPTAALSAEQIAADAPTFINCVALPSRTPEVVSLTCLDNSDQVTNIEWDSWDESGATGHGVRVTDGHEVGEVEIELSEPFNNGTSEVFSVISIDGEEIIL